MKGLEKKFHLNGKTIGFYQKTQESQQGEWGGGVLRLPSDRNDQRIFWGLKFSILGFFWVGKFWQVFFLG